MQYLLAMRKVVIHSPGNYEQLKVEEFPDLRPKTGQVVIEVKAFGINYADIVVRWGLYESAKQFVGWPITPGFEFSGIVKESLAEKFKAGDRVFGVCLFNAYATEVCVPEHQVYPLPAGMSFDEAAGFPAVMLTAYHGLLQNVVTRSGMLALVHSAGGGVGSSLIQLCKVKGIQTIGVVGSSHKVDFVKSIGCDYVIDKSKEDLWARVKKLAPHGPDLVFDANGVETLKQSYDHLASTGKLIAYGAHSMFPKKGGKVNWIKLAWDYLRTPRFNMISMMSENKSLVTFNLSFLFGKRELFEEGMRELIHWYEAGLIRAPMVTAYPIDKIGSAHSALESGQTVGKLVINP